MPLSFQLCKHGSRAARCRALRQPGGLLLGGGPVALCAQPFGWRTLVVVARTLLLPDRDFKGEVRKRTRREARPGEARGRGATPPPARTSLGEPGSGGRRGGDSRLGRASEGMRWQSTSQELSAESRLDRGQRRALPRSGPRRQAGTAGGRVSLLALEKWPGGEEREVLKSKHDAMIRLFLP